VEDQHGGGEPAAKLLPGVLYRRKSQWASRWTSQCQSKCETWKRKEKKHLWEVGHDEAAYSGSSRWKQRVRCFSVARGDASGPRRSARAR
jgi:hypothetical protein